jgi:hypothetical protein
MIQLTASFKKSEINKIEKAIKSNLKKITPEIVDEVARVTKDALRYRANQIFKTTVAENAPTPEEEKFHLSHGTDDKGRDIGGNPDASRFMKGSYFKTLRQAIYEDAKFSMSTQKSGNSVRINFELSSDSYDKISREIGFAWLKKIGSNSLILRSTLNKPIWLNLLNMWEYGSAGSFTVEPRDAGSKLNPGDRNNQTLLTKYMRKSIPPYRMFERGMDIGRDLVLEELKTSLTARFKK